MAGVLISSHYVDRNVRNTAFSVSLFSSLIALVIKKTLAKCLATQVNLLEGQCLAFYVK